MSGSWKVTQFEDKTSKNKLRCLESAEWITKYSVENIWNQRETAGFDFEYVVFLYYACSIR